MPKNKPHSGLGKKVRVTGSGKIRRQSTNRVHKLERKTSSHKRRLDGTTDVAKVDVPRVKRLLGR